MPSSTDNTVPHGSEMLAIFGSSKCGALHERHETTAAASRQDGSSQAHNGTPFFTGSGITAGRATGAAPHMLVLAPTPSALPSPLGTAAKMLFLSPAISPAG